MGRSLRSFHHMISALNTGNNLDAWFFVSLPKGSVPADASMHPNLGGVYPMRELPSPIVAVKEGKALRGEPTECGSILTRFVIPWEIR